MLQINGAEVEVLSPVSLEWLTDQKGEGLPGYLYALGLCPNLRGLHDHHEVFALAVWGPWAIVFCGGLTSNGQGSLQQEASQCRGLPYQNHQSEGVG